MSASSSKMFADHTNNLSSSKKSVVFLSMLLFDINSSSEVLIRDDPLQSRRHLRSKHSKIKKSCTSNDCDVIRSSTDLATSASLIHNIATVRQPEQEHTSVSKISLPTLGVSCVMEFIEMQVQDLNPRNFDHTILEKNSYCTIQRIPGRVRTDSVEEEPLGLQCLTMTLAT